MSIGTQIANYRKKLGLTQEALAQQLGVTNQAVSKWESDQCCPDLMLLPKIADIFSISIDCLFDREAPAPETCAAPPAAEAPAYPWPDDDMLRVMLFWGHSRIEEKEALSRVRIDFRGNARDIYSDFAISCEQVYGNVTSAGSVDCDAVMGYVQAGGNVNCDDVAGNVQAGGNVSCDDIGGSVTAGANVTCDEIHGPVSVGRGIE